jgi:hypothetical protein
MDNPELKNSLRKKSQYSFQNLLRCLLPNCLVPIFSGFNLLKETEETSREHLHLAVSET